MESVLYVDSQGGYVIVAGTSTEDAIKAMIEQAVHNGSIAHPWANSDEIDVTAVVDGVEITATPQSTEDELLNFWRKNR